MGTGNSYIVFNNKSDSLYKLYSEEVYNLSLTHTQLLILSACKSGTGDWVKGEGLMSLSRAFTYAGCPNIITSLWKAHDFSTAYICRRIHYYLNRDYSVDRALQQAKMDYLSDPSVNPRLKHPYYWCHLVFIGNFQQEKPSYILGYSLLVLSIVGLGMLYVWKGRKRD